MPSFKTILFSADFSEHTRDAFQIACALAQGSATRVIVLHVVEPALFEKETTSAGTSGFPVFFPTDSKSHREALQERLLEFYPPDQAPGVEHVVRDGADAAREVLAAAREVAADLIVMGTHGRTGLGRLLMGSVAAAVMRGAHCPVIAVKVPIADEPLTEPEPAQG